MPGSSVISVRLKLQVLEKLHEYSELLNIRPSTLISLIVEENMDDWVKNQSDKVYTKIWKNK